MGYCVETRDELINSPQIRGENKNLCPIRAQKEGKAMKRSFAMALALALAFTLVACGGEKQTETEIPPSPPDLTGSWKQTNSNSEDAWQSAEISDSTIEVYWITDKGDTKSLYWAGTFSAPETADEPYTWESANDKDKTGTALLASSDDTKSFTYENGEISYEVSAFGVTQTVRLEKQS